VLVHGGYWRSRRDSDTLHALANDLTARGFAAWNVVSRIVTFGHSAGGHLVVRLVVRLAADRVSSSLRPAPTVSLVGWLAGWLPGPGLDPRAGAVGARRRARPRRDPAGAAHRLHGLVCTASSARPRLPLSRLPIRSPLAVVCCRGDDPDLLDVSRRFAAAAQAAGDQVHVVEDEGDHYSVIDPAASVWASVAALLEDVRR